MSALTATQIEQDNYGFCNGIIQGLIWSGYYLSSIDRKNDFQGMENCPLTVSF
jgi:hypothetical protein